MLGAQLIETSTAITGHETLRLTDAGLQKLAEARECASRTPTPHNLLACRVAQHLMDSGRIVWRELSVRAQFSGPNHPPACQPGCITKLPLELPSDASPVEHTAARPTSWRIARPDVFSVRDTSVEDYLYPMVHEVKVNRGDLLAELRNTAKRASYQWLCCECFWVFPSGLAQPHEIPEELGIWVLHGGLNDGIFELYGRRATYCANCRSSCG